MAFRPSLIPEPARPLVLFPIYLVRSFVQILFTIVNTLLVALIVIICPAPLVTKLVLFLKILLSASLFSIFLAVLFASIQQRKALLDLLHRAEEVASGDIIAAALLAAELSAKSASAVADQAGKALKTVASFDVVNTAGDVSKGAVQVTSVAVGAVADTTGQVIDATGIVVGGTVDATVEISAGAVDFAAGTIDETARLVTNPGDLFGAVGNIAAGAVDMTVNTAQVTTEFAVVAAQNTATVAGEAGNAASDVARNATSVAGGVLQKMMELDPVYIFKRVVNLVMDLSMYVVVTTPVVLFIIACALQSLRVQPTALELDLLSLLLAVVGIPGYFWVRKRARKLLANASSVIAEMNEA